jgi:hypothetical protein
VPGVFQEQQCSCLVGHTRENGDNEARRGGADEKGLGPVHHCNYGVFILNEKVIIEESSLASCPGCC